MIRISHLNKRYGRKIILTDISFQLEPCTYGLLGPNGAGKTTIMRILAGIEKANSGSINIEYGKTGFGYLPQKFGCFPNLSVYEQMEYFACLKKIPRSQHKSEIMRVLETVNMDKNLLKKCRTLSGGMVRRVGIAQALLGNPSLLLLDEPTVGLDPEERNNFNSIIRKLEGHVTILLSTHLIEDIKALCQQVIVMESGKILKVAKSDTIASLARGKVYFLPEKNLRGLKTSYYIESNSDINGEKYVRVVFLEDVNCINLENMCEPDLVDGYLYIIKRQGLSG